jgi:hypothetical protein
MTLEEMIKVTTQEEADRCLKEYVDELMAETGKKRRAAKKIAKTNIGYYAGYYDDETIRRIWRLYRTRHPVFGRSFPTPVEAFNLGRKWAKKKRS